MSNNTNREYSQDKVKESMQQTKEPKMKSQNIREKKDHEQSTMNDDDLYEYMFNHVAFDEIPYDKDPLYDHREIYTHETSNIEYGLYENLLGTAQLLHSIDNDRNQIHIDECAQYIHDLGRPSTKREKTVYNAMRKEIMDHEDDEIIKMNARITQLNENMTEEEMTKISQVQNKDMSESEIMLPVYTPSVHEHHGVMFANSSKSVSKDTYRNILEDTIENEYYEHDYEKVIENETFIYKDTVKNEYIPMVEATCLSGESAPKVHFDNQLYAVITYEEGHKLVAMYRNELEIPTMIDNGASVNVIPKWYYDQHNELHDLPKSKDNVQNIMTGNGQIKTHFWIEIPVNIQGVLMQLKCLVCDSHAPHGLLLSRLALNQMHAIQLYDKRQLYIAINTYSLEIVEATTIIPGKRKTVAVRIKSRDPKMKEVKVQGDAISWIKTSNPGYPLQPVVTEFTNNLTTVEFANASSVIRHLKPGETIGYLDLRSKDGSLADVQWLIPVNREGDYIVYGHTATFGSAIERQFLADEDGMKQKNNRLDYVDKPIIDPKPVDKTDDPYPWLDREDPRRQMTDRDILVDKIKLDTSILTAEERVEFIDMLLENREAFSLRDEIGTCPHFEVKLELRDETPFFVRPYPIREEQKKIVQREMERLEKLGIIIKGLTGYSSPVLLVKRKQQNLFRVVTDFRVLNERLVRVNHAFPLVRDCLDAIGNSNCQVFTVIDLRDAYHTLRLAKASQKYCGITPFYGSPTYQYVRMGMGMSCSPGIWGQFADYIRQKLPNKERYRIIMDDILIFSTEETHKQDIEDLLKVLIQYGLRISPHKCQMFRNSLVYMGLHFMIKDQKPCFEPMKDKCDAIRNMLPLKTVKECRQFCGMVNFLSTFLPKLREYLIPIYALTKKKATFKWTEECQNSFDKIKGLLQKPPVLRMPTGTGIFRLESDTSREAAGGALYQFQEDGWALIGYHSKRLPDAVRNYGVCELELTGLVCNIHGFEHLLKNNYFEVIIDHKAIEYLKKAKYEPTTRRLGSLLLKLQDYTFDIKYLEGTKLKVSDALSRLYIEEKHKITDVIPLNFLLHTATPFTHLDYLNHAWTLYKHQAVDTQIKPRRKNKQTRQRRNVQAIVLSNNKSSVNAGGDNLSRKTPRKATKQPLEQQMVPGTVDTITQEITNRHINPTMKTLFDITNDSEIITSVREPGSDLIEGQRPLIKPTDKITIYRRHIPQQVEIDKALTELRTKVLRQMLVNIETGDLIREYDKTVRFKDVYAYIARDKLPGNVATQKKIIGEAANYVVANHLLFKIENVKECGQWRQNPLLVIPEKFEPNIFHMYHNSLFACHQGLWKTFLTIRKHYYIPNLLMKLRNFIDACIICQRGKPQVNKQRPYFGYIPKDYTPLEHLAVDIKYMPVGFDGYLYLIVATCEQTNFVFAIPAKERNARTVADALVHRIFTITGPPQYLSVDKDRALTGEVISLLLTAMQCTMQIISPWNHGSSKAERQIQTIGLMITKQLKEKGETWPLYASVAAYAMNTFVSRALNGFSPFELVFARKPRDLSSVGLKAIHEYPIALREYAELLHKRAEFIRKFQMNWKTQQILDKRTTHEMYKDIKRFVKDDIVYALSPEHAKLETKRRKFRLDYIGPLAIAEVLDDTHYKLKLITGQKDILPDIWHINRLKAGAEILPEGVARSRAQLQQYLTNNQSQVYNTLPMIT